MPDESQVEMDHLILIPAGKACKTLTNTRVTREADVMVDQCGQKQAFAHTTHLNTTQHRNSQRGLVD